MTVFGNLLGNRSKNNDGKKDEEQEEKKNMLNEDMVRFMSKRSETDTARYADRLQKYVKLQNKQKRAAGGTHTLTRECTAKIKRVKSSLKRNTAPEAKDDSGSGNTESPANGDGQIHRRGQSNSETCPRCCDCIFSKPSSDGCRSKRRRCSKPRRRRCPCKCRRRKRRSCRRRRPRRRPQCGCKRRRRRRRC